MRPLSRYLATATVGYLLGTIPSADLAARLAAGPDLRNAGSGNPGAANAAAVLGAPYGFAVLVTDIAKGTSAGRLGLALAGATGAQLGATSAVIGHCYPLWTGFRGGKGVAVSVGQVLATFPVYFPVDAVVAVATAASPRWKRRAFASTGVASIVWVLASSLWWRRQWSTAWGPGATVALPLGAMASSIVIMNRFRQAARSTARQDSGNELASEPVDQDR